ncbi:MAG: type I-F CRISPR-associated protein Csy1, partial [Comamonas sp.]|nr:type I-F CRISPR-associated protein Csy1 [Candidatus Comamonas equi]
MAESEKVPIYGSFKEAVHAFIQMRLQAKLEKLDNDDPKRQELLGQHVAEVWLEDAARRVQQIQAVTHSLKPIHPDARGTNLYVEPTQLAPLQEVGSHALGREFASDVVGNAAALDVYKLLKLEVGSQTLLAALLANDAGALQALHEDAEQAKALRDAFVSITAARAGGPSSHARAKQLFWLEGDDATGDAQFALLAPLYA